MMLVDEAAYNPLKAAYNPLNSAQRYETNLSTTTEALVPPVSISPLMPLSPALSNLSPMANLNHITVKPTPSCFSIENMAI